MDIVRNMMLLIVASAFNLLNAQDSILLNQAQVDEDNLIFISALTEAHPGLNLYLKNDQIDSLLKSVESMKGNVTLKEYYIKLLSAITLIGDGHTDISEGELFRKSNPYFERILPFDFVIINNKIYVHKSLSQANDIPPLTEIISINGLKPREILDFIYNLTPSDGNRMGFKEKYVEKTLRSSIPKLLTLTNSYEMKFKNPDGSFFKRTINGINQKNIKPDTKDLLSLIINTQDNYAVITVNTFQYKLIIKEEGDFNKRIKDIFRKVKKSGVENLIIDLRENYGGDNILAINLFSYLETGAFKAMNPSLTKLRDTISVSRYSNFPTGQYPFLKTHKIAPVNDEYSALKEGIDSKESYNSDFIFNGFGSKPDNIFRYKFSGKTFCLISGLTFSAAANLSTLLNRKEETVFIGQETGGANGDYCGGGFYQIILPNSKFQLQIPYMRRSVANAKNNKTGTIPDFIIARDHSSILKETDPELEKAIEIIKN